MFNLSWVCYRETLNLKKSCTLRSLNFCWFQHCCPLYVFEILMIINHSFKWYIHLVILSYNLMLIYFNDYFFFITYLSGTNLFKMMRFEMFLFHRWTFACGSAFVTLSSLLAFSFFLSILCVCVWWCFYHLIWSLGTLFLW